MGGVEGREDQGLSIPLPVLHLPSHPRVELFFRGDVLEDGYLGEGGGLAGWVAVLSRVLPSTEGEAAVVVGESVVVAEVLLDGGMPVDLAPLPELVVVEKVV